MTTLTHDDSYNIRLCLDGNADAFEPLVRRYQNAAFAVAMSFLRDRSDAEDVVQDAFVAAYCKLSQLKDPAIFGSWLHRIVVNHCKDWRRRKNVDRLVRVGSESESVRGAYLLADQVHRNYIECLEIWDEVERLPEHYRQVVTLYYYTGFSLKEIAAFLEIPESTARGRLYQSRIRLKDALSPQEKETISMSQIDVTEEVRDVVCKIAREDFSQTLDMGETQNIVLYCGVNTEVDIGQAPGEQVIVKGSKIALGLTEKEAQRNVNELQISHDQVDNYLETGPHDGALFLGVKNWFPDNVPYSEPISTCWKHDLKNESVLDEKRGGVKMVDALPDSRHEIDAFLPLPVPAEKCLGKSVRITVHASEARPIKMPRDAVSDNVARVFRSMQSDSTRVYGPATYCHVSVAVPSGMNISIFRSDRVNIDGLDGSLMAYSCSSCQVNEITGDVYLFNSVFSEIGSVGGSLYQRMYGYGGNEGCGRDGDMLRRIPLQNEGKIEAVKGDVDIDVGCMDLNVLDLEGEIAIYNRYGKTRLTQSSRNKGQRCYVRSVSGDVDLVLDRKRAKNVRLVMHTICGVAKYGELKELMPIMAWPHNAYWMTLGTTDDFVDPDITILTESGTVDIRVAKNGKHS